MRFQRLVLGLLLLLLPLGAGAEEVKLPCVADTNVSSYDTERELNYGQTSHLRLKGIEMLGLCRFDTKPIEKWRIQKATIHLRYAGAVHLLRTLGFSTISAPWEEGTGNGEKKPGEVCFAWREQGKTRWAGPETDFTDCTYTNGNTLASYADIRDEGDGWFAADVDPRIVRAMAAGASYGMAVSDEKGQTMANNDVYSREQSGSAPYLTVTGTPVASPEPPKSVGNPHGAPDPLHADFTHGAVRLEMAATPGIERFNIALRPTGQTEWSELPRREIPFPDSGAMTVVKARNLRPFTIYEFRITAVSSTGGTLTATTESVSSPAKLKPSPFRTTERLKTIAGSFWPYQNKLFVVSAYPGTEKAHPISGNVLEEAGAAKYAGAPESAFRWNSVGDADGAVSLLGARGETLGFNVLVEAGSPPLTGVAISMSPDLKPVSAGQALQISPALFRDWYVKDGDWYPEICVPLHGTFDIPAKDNAVPGQRNQSIYVEFVIPKTAQPGKYTGKITVTGAARKVDLPVYLTVNSLTMPDRLSFDVSLNTYGTVGGEFGVDDRTPEYRAIEREYHRMAHAHRATFAPLCYSHGGTWNSNYAPPLAGEGANLHVADWTAWDAQFGPYLDGTAFKGLPRDGVPLTHFYLLFHEAWPVDIRQHYRYQQTVHDYPAMITEHAMKAPPIEQAIDSELPAGFKSVLRDFMKHFQEKGWTKTRFQLYQNDKYYYKDPKQGGRGTSWWLLDEPNHRDDWLALAYFARLLRDAQKEVPGSHIIHREDISRPQWQRDYLDGLVDLMVVSSEIYNKGPLLADMKERLHVRYWNYGSASPVNRSNLEEEAWGARAWLAGADAVVPWQTVGTDENYTKPEETALLLPGKRFGLMGPVASLRLKALRRAQQDAEYLNLLSKEKGWDREQVAAAIGPLLNLQGTFEQRGSEDAGRYRFGAMRASQFEAMRQAIAAALSH